MVMSSRNKVLRALRQFELTAEHLKPRSEGGADTENNIVAACWFCNKSRHRRKLPMTPERFKQYVRDRMAANRWHCAYHSSE